MEETKKKNKRIFYLMLGVSILLISGITGAFAYFSASKTTPNGTITGTTNNINNDTLNLNVERINFTGATANYNLVPAYFGKNSYDQLNVRYPSDLKQANVTSMVSNKCEKDGFTGCHVYKITFSSTKTIPEANLLLNLSVTAADEDIVTDQWGYALFTETGNIVNHETTGLTLLTGNGVPGGIGGGRTNLDIHNGGGLTANTPVIYYLLIYINDNDEIQNVYTTPRDEQYYEDDHGWMHPIPAAYNYNVLGTYNGSVTLQAMGGQVRANFAPQAPVTPLTDFDYVIGGNGDFSSEPTSYVFLTNYAGTSPVVNVPSLYTIEGNEYTPVIYTRSLKGVQPSGAFVNNTTITDVTLSNDVLIAFKKGISPLTYNDATVTFSGCTSLVNAPTIPSSVTNMAGTFDGCTSLVNAPVIPSSVTNMAGTFDGCTSLVNAPAIPSSVTNMNNIFYGCTNLEGTVMVNSSVVEEAEDAFSGTTKSITLSVPSTGTTLTTFQNSSLPANVTLTTH